MQRVTYDRAHRQSDKGAHVDITNLTAEEAVQQRYELLKEFTHQTGLVWYATRMTMSQLETFGAETGEEFFELLLFIQSELPETNDLQAAFNALNIQLSFNLSEIEREELFVLEHRDRNWSVEEHRAVHRQVNSGLRTLATVFDTMQRYFAQHGSQA